MTATGFGNFIIGAPVQGRDGSCGVLDRFVLHPTGQVVTYLVVEPNHRKHSGCLVPIELVEAADATIQLGCTRAEYANLAAAKQKMFLAAGKRFSTRGEAFYTQERIAPTYTGPSSPGDGSVVTTSVARAFITNVPVDEVEIKHRARVQASDGRLGELRGLVVDPSEHHVNYVLIGGRHHWRKDHAAVPVSAVKTISGDSIRLSL